MLLDVKVLESIKEAQALHGLKYENYQSYRSYCSRRLHRLRRSLNVHQGVPTSAKARHQRSRKTINITNAMVLEAGEKVLDYGERMLLIPLYLADRAWAYAMQLKQEVTDQPRKIFHLRRRLRKAMVYAQRFEKLCHEEDSPCSEETKIESEAYASYISGLYYFETENWFSAKDCLTKALNIYFRLNLWCDYRERINEIQASLRYCNFNLGSEDVKVSSDIPKMIKFHDIAFQHASQYLVAKRNGAKSNDRKRDSHAPTLATTLKDENEDDDDEENWDDACEDLS